MKGHKKNYIDLLFVVIVNALLLIFFRKNKSSGNLFFISYTNRLYLVFYLNFLKEDLLSKKPCTFF